MKPALLLFLVFCLGIFTAYAQQKDSLAIKKTKPDTVVIYKPPVVIRSAIYLNKEKQRTWMGDAFIGIGYTWNQFSFCPSCIAYNTKFQRTHSNPTSYHVGIAISKWLGKAVVTASISNLGVRDRFTSGDTVLTCSTHFFNIGILAGYDFRFSKLHIIPSFGPVISILGSTKGSYLSHPSLTWKSAHSNLYYRSALGVMFKAKVMWLCWQRGGLFIEPFMIGDIQNYVRSDEVPFSAWKRTIGTHLGICYLW